MRDMADLWNFTLLRSYGERGDRLVGEMREALRAEAFATVDARYEEVCRLVREMRGLNPLFLPRAREIESMANAVHAERERVERIREVLDTIEITGIARAPGHDMAIVNGVPCEVGEELPNPGGGRFDGIFVSAVDDLGRVVLSVGDQTFTVPLDPPEWWRERLNPQGNR